MSITTVGLPLSEEHKTKIDAMSREDLCRMWRFAVIGETLLQGAAGDYFKERLFKHFDGFSPEISKAIGWGNSR